MIDASRDPLPRPAPRGVHTHKGDFGRVLVVGGSRAMAGAPALSGMACLRSGAGLVTLLVPESAHAVAAGFCPAYMTRCLPTAHQGFDAALGRTVNELSGDADAIAIGPGLGRSAYLTQAVAELYASITTPMVVDADGLNALSEALDHLAAPGGPRVLTPHAGELARLRGEPLQDAHDDRQRLDAARQLAGCDPSEQTVVVLKGARSVVADARRYSINSTGNPGMATAGAGDVLTGVIAALLGQGMPAFDAARLAVHVHGLAGDLGAAKLGAVGVTATDLIDYLPAAWSRLAD